MDIPTLLIWGLALALMAIALRRGDGAFSSGLTGAGRTVWGLLPLLTGVFIIVGFADVLLPKELIARWMGGDSGLKGIFIATGLGAITPGGPFVSYPLVATFYKAGAGIGPLVAFVTAWALLAVSRLPLEIALVGPRLTLIRLASSFIFAPLAGIVARALFGGSS